MDTRKIEITIKEHSDRCEIEFLKENIHIYQIIGVLKTVLISQEQKLIEKNKKLLK